MPKWHISRFVQNPFTNISLFVQQKENFVLSSYRTISFLFEHEYNHLERNLKILRELDTRTSSDFTIPTLKDRPYENSHTYTEEYTGYNGEKLYAIR